ncbi:potassium-transporting ATPase subunit F [Mycobacterium sp. GA-2829]|nr:potassium-transporting ATPase subunit F [Mycobacterium sp. GA-2829]
MGRTAVITNLVGLALAVAIVVFLFAALLFPERL